VDTLHGITLLFIFFIVAASVYSLHLVKKDKFKQSYKFDLVMAQVLLLLYIIVNIWFISHATSK
jgi:hypothetical protein